MRDWYNSNTAWYAPADVVRIMQEKEGIFYAYDDGFYLWNGRIWKLLAERNVKIYIDYLCATHGQRPIGNKVIKEMKREAVRNMQFNRKPVVTFLNGTLELDTGLFRAFSADDFSTVLVDCCYNPETMFYVRGIHLCSRKGRKNFDEKYVARLFPPGQVIYNCARPGYVQQMAAMRQKGVTTTYDTGN